MENNLHETFVNFEVAKMLKAACFDWDCKYVYDLLAPIACSNNEVCSVFVDKNPNRFDDLVSAPTLEVAQKWLREVKGIYIGIVALENKHAVDNSDGLTFHYEYDKPVFDCDIQNERCETIITLDGSFGTYEDAQAAGIKHGVEMLLKK